ncbi:MAG: excinuclease ABC subunit UvrC, partial [Pseudomonadota bacterium]
PNYCVQVFFIRGGQHYGNRAYFPSKAADSDINEVYNSFLGQFYQFHHPPKLILVNQVIDFKLFTDSLSQLAGCKVKIKQPQKGDKAELMRMAEINAVESLGNHQKLYHQHEELFIDIAKIFNLKQTPRRIEVYDNSHISGKHAVGAMVVANNYGLCKEEYRKFNLKTGSESGTGGDDLAMHREVINRRLTRLLRDCPTYSEEIWPDLIIIDGGKNQLNAVLKIVKEHGIDIPVVAMAKGEFRDKGDEVFWQHRRESFTLPNSNSTMQLLQRLRDEVHRYAITTHRQSRIRAIRTSLLDNITGIGAKRRRDLINHFGSIEAIANANQAQLMLVNGININIVVFGFANGFVIQVYFLKNLKISSATFLLIPLTNINCA